MAPFPKRDQEAASTSAPRLGTVCWCRTPSPYKLGNHVELIHALFFFYSGASCSQGGAGLMLFYMQFCAHGCKCIFLIYILLLGKYRCVATGAQYNVQDYSQMHICCIRAR
jgi:hypothetical protein